MAVEGSSVAGPIGGTDMRSAQLPPPGLYGAAAVAYGEVQNFFDGHGRKIAALSALEQATKRGGVALLYVPPVQVLGGAIGLGAVLPVAEQCGRLFAVTPRRCLAGLADPYVELNWSRYFGTPRPSRNESAYPIPEGLTVQFGFGTVVPIGRYSASVAASHGLTVGNNIWDFAPLAAFTYVSLPILGEGTELSAKAYLNTYLTNPDTQYQTGSVINVDFALTERIGRIQFGLAGAYVGQVEDDTLFNNRVGPYGRRVEVISLGLAAVYDMPEFGASIKVKGLTSVAAKNAVEGFGLSLTFFKKLY